VTMVNLDRHREIVVDITGRPPGTDPDVKNDPIPLLPKIMTIEHHSVGAKKGSRMSNNPWDRQRFGESVLFCRFE